MSGETQDLKSRGEGPVPVERTFCPDPQGPCFVLRTPLGERVVSVGGEYFTRWTPSYSSWELPVRFPVTSVSRKRRLGD